MSEKILIGIPAAPGLAIGTAFIFRHDNPHIREYILPYEKREEEECRLKEALIVSESQLADLYQQILEQTNRAVAQIFEAQKTIMTDELFVSEIKSRVVNEGTNAEYAVSFVTDWMIKSFSRSTSDLLRQKTQDIRDVGNRLIRNLMGDPGKGFDLPNHPVVFIAANLLPSDIVNFQKSSIIGVGTDQGGAASHTAILTRSLNVPAVIGLKNISELAKTGDRIIINGNSGKVFLNPGNDTEISYQKKLVSFKKYISSLADIEKLPSTTLDGRRIKLRGNIEIPRESKFLNSRGADGVGLFRSEYIILTQKSLPDEAIQYNEYCKIIKSVSPNPVTIRTFDLGGDKVFPNLPHPVELNPFMGWRSIRVSLDNPEQLRTQLRAILRAGTTGKVKLMFPFVS
ncbi:phosphoenolpyruvate--protein phosphotransferase, partial [bacterium]|nr:phosphoenolpyruvate--protein phosphotransferase [bacterium]